MFTLGVPTISIFLELDFLSLVPLHFFVKFIFDHRRWSPHITLSAVSHRPLLRDATLLMRSVDGFRKPTVANSILFLYEYWQINSIYGKFVLTWSSHLKLGARDDFINRSVNFKLIFSWYGNGDFSVVMRLNNEPLWVTWASQDFVVRAALPSNVNCLSSAVSLSPKYCSSALPVSLVKAQHGPPILGYVLLVPDRS